MPEPVRTAQMAITGRREGEPNAICERLRIRLQMIFRRAVALGFAVAADAQEIGVGVLHLARYEADDEADAGLHDEGLAPLR